MACPYLHEVRMLFCEAYPVKMLPTDRVGATSHCEAGDFRDCPLFREAAAAGSPVAKGESKPESGSDAAAKENDPC